MVSSKEMMTVPPAISRQNDIAQIVSEAGVELRPIVKRIFGTSVRIGAGIGQSICESCCRITRAETETCGRVCKKSKVVSEKLQPDNLGVIAYFNYRNEAEQAALGKKAWKEYD